MKKSLIVERLEAVKMSELDRARAIHALETSYAISEGILSVVHFVRKLRRRMTFHTPATAK